MRGSTIGLASLAFPEETAEGGGLSLEELGLLLALETTAITTPLKTGRGAHKSPCLAGGGDGAGAPMVSGVEPARSLERQS
jgi:hypothetical protein